MASLMSIAKPTGLKAGIARRASPALFKRHALRCRPVAFKDGDKDMDNLPFLPDSKTPSSSSLRNQPDIEQKGLKVNPAVPAFTRRREVLAGRAAMVGFFAACLWEANLSGHPGVIGQISLFTGVSPSAVGIFLLALIGYNAFGGLLPSLSAENKADAAKRPPGPTNAPNQQNNIFDFFGIDSWGFTKKNEVFNGRIAMMGIFFAVVQEYVMGGVGPLGQLARYINVVPDSSYYSLAVKSLTLFAALATGFAILEGNIQSPEDEKEIY